MGGNERKTLAVYLYAKRLKLSAPKKEKSNLTVQMPTLKTPLMRSSQKKKADS